MKCHILFSEKNKKNISKCRLLKILPRVLSVNKMANLTFKELSTTTTDFIIIIFFFSEKKHLKFYVNRLPTS